ncbi:hypothetical protein ISCGN_019895 [Ixodes scapularis]
MVPSLLPAAVHLCHPNLRKMLPNSNKCRGPTLDAPQEQERQVPYIVPSTTPLGADLEEGVIGPHLVAPDDPQDEEAQGPHIGTPQRTSMGSTAAAVAGPSTSSTADRRATPKRQVGRPKKPSFSETTRKEEARRCGHADQRYTRGDFHSGPALGEKVAEKVGETHLGADQSRR